MAKPKVELYNSFNEWRIITNNLSDEIGDLATTYTSDGSGEHLVNFTAPSDLIVAVNDLNTRKVKRSGDTMIGSLHFEQPTLTADDPFIDGHVTWNNAAVAFSGFHIDVTNIASHVDSLLIDCRLEGAPKFGVDVNGGIIQKLTGSYMARDVVSGSRHVREYQDLNDANANGLPNTKIEWGFTWNAKWNGSVYIKDRSNANDHAIMHRIDNSFRDQMWFSDGTTLNSPITFVKRIDFDYNANTGWIDLNTTIVRDFTIGANKLTVASATGNTAIAGTLTVAGVTTINNTVSVPSHPTALNTLSVSSTSIFNGGITANSGLSLVGGTVTSSTPFLTATQTWNNAGITFSGIVVDITNSASGENSLLMDFKAGGVQTFGVSVAGTVVQKLSGNFLARDIVAGTRHVREYQDLNDASAQGLEANKNEWGFTFNAKWDTGSYLKDRNNAGDHAVMMRMTNSYKQQWWFSDGTSPGTISWVKKIDYDLPNNTGWMDLTLNVLRDFAVNTNKFTVASATGNTLVAGTFGVTGASTLAALGCTSLTASGAAILQSTLAVTGDVAVNTNKFNVTAASGNTTIAGTLGVTGNIAVNTNKFTVAATSGNTIIAGTLGVTGDVTLSATLGVESNFAINTNKFTVVATSGNTTIAGTLGVTGATVLSSTLAVASDFTLNTNKFVVLGTSGNTSIAGTLGVAGATALSSTLTVTGDVAINTNKFNIAAISGNTTIAGTLGVAGASTLAGVGCTTLTASGTTLLQSTLAVTGDVAVNTNKFNIAAISGNTTIAGTLGVTLATTLSSTLAVTGDVAINTNKFNVTAASGNTTIAGTLGVTSDVAVNTNKFNVTAASGNTTIAGTLGVTGSSTLAGVGCTTLTASGAALLQSTLTVTGNSTLPSITLSGSNAYAGVGSILLKNATNVVSDLTASGNANKILGANAAATGFELKSFTSSDSTVIFDLLTAGVIDIKTSGVFPGSVSFTGSLSVGSPAKFTVAGATGNTVISGSLSVAGASTLAATSATTISASTSISTPKIVTGTFAEQFVATLTTTSTTADQVLISLAGSSYRSATFEIQAVDAIGAKFHKVIISSVHNGADVDSVEYGAVVLGGQCGTFTMDYNTGNMRLLVTPSSTNSTVFKVLVRSITV